MAKAASNVHTLNAASELEAESAKEAARKEAARIDAEHTAAIQPWLEKARTLGIAKARGANSLTQLCYDYQAGVIAGVLVRGDNERLYNAYADAHDAHLSTEEMADSGFKTISEESRAPARSNLLTFSNPFVLAQGRELYKRVIEARASMDKETRHDESPLSSFVRINRRVAEMGEAVAESVSPDNLVIEDSQIVEWLTKESAAKSAKKTPLEKLEKVIAELTKLEKDPAFGGDLEKVLASARKAAAAYTLREAEKAEAVAHAEIIKAAIAA
jgi:hypothetical protein